MSHIFPVGGVGHAPLEAFGSGLAMPGPAVAQPHPEAPQCGSHTAPRRTAHDPRTSGGSATSGGFRMWLTHRPTAYGARRPHQRWPSHTPRLQNVAHTPPPRSAGHDPRASGGPATTGASRMWLTHRPAASDARPPHQRCPSHNPRLQDVAHTPPHGVRRTTPAPAVPQPQPEPPGCGSHTAQRRASRAGELSPPATYRRSGGSGTPRRCERPSRPRPPCPTPAGRRASCCRPRRRPSARRRSWRTCGPRPGA